MVGDQFGGMEMYDNGTLHGWGGMWFGPLLMWGLPILLIVLVVWLLRGSGGVSTQPKSAHDACEILDERFARGEIDEEEYQRRRQAIDGVKIE